MNNLLKADFYKLKRSKAFWICTLVGMVISVLMVVAMKATISRALAQGPDSRG